MSIGASKVSGTDNELDPVQAHYCVSFADGRANHSYAAAVSNCCRPYFQIDSKPLPVPDSIGTETFELRA